MKTAFIAVMAMHFSMLNAQTTITTNGSGNFNSPSTWSTGVVPSGNCNCTIQIQAGHQVTLTTTPSLSNVAFQLLGSGSQLLFAGTNDLNLTGTASIDLQNSNARIFSGNQNNIITISGTTIFKGNNTKVNSTVAGEVLGPASASSLRADPNFINSTLPVKLTDFKAATENNSILLSWATAAEINSDAFEVERSIDSKIWNTIGKVNASGNSGIEQKYSYTDVSPFSGTNYYRLKMIDKDAAFEYSSIRNASITSLGWIISTSPNPVSSVLNINMSQLKQASSYRMKIFNHFGQAVYDQQYAGSVNRISINTANFIQGMYILEISNNSGMHQTNKIIVSRQ